MQILITILVTAVIVGPICWLGGAKNAVKTNAIKSALKGTSSSGG